MADQIGSFKFINQTQLGTLKDLGFKRAVAVLWKATRGDKPGVEGMFQRNFARMEARAAIVSATADREFAADWNGLLQLLGRARQRDAHDPRNAATDTVYKATLFATAWDSTIGRNKQALRDWNVANRSAGLDHRTLKSTLRDAFSRNDLATVDRDLENIDRLGYVARYEVGPRRMDRSLERMSVEHDLERIPYLPPGVAASHGSNFRYLKPKQDAKGDWLPLQACRINASFAIRPEQSKVALALAEDGLDRCTNVNDLPSHSSGGLVAEILDDGRLHITRSNGGAHGLWAIVLPNKGHPNGRVIDLDKTGVDESFPGNTILVALSEEAAAAFARLPDSEIGGTFNPAELKSIAASSNPADEVQGLVCKLVNRSTGRIVVAREKALETLQVLDFQKNADRPMHHLQHEMMVERINHMLDTVDADEDRVSMQQTPGDFAATLRRIMENFDRLKNRIVEPFGGDLAVVAVSPRRFLGLESKAPTDRPEPLG